MTNEEKSKKIAEQNLMTYVALENDGGTYEVNSEDECYQSAMEMAEWKDDKFFAILACIKFSLEKQGFSADVFVEGIQKQWEE